MEKIMARIALSELRKLKNAEAEFYAEREEWYRNGDGRSPRWVERPDGRSVNMGGKGYSFPIACVHGSDAWTDYDNICGPCEDGYSVYQLALWRAQERYDEYRKRVDWLASAPPSFQWEQKAELIDWACAPVRESGE